MRASVRSSTVTQPPRSSVVSGPKISTSPNSSLVQLELASFIQIIKEEDCKESPIKPVAGFPMKNSYDNSQAPVRYMINTMDKNLMAAKVKTTYDYIFHHGDIEEQFQILDNSIEENNLIANTEYRFYGSMSENLKYYGKNIEVMSGQTGLGKMSQKAKLDKCKLGSYQLRRPTNTDESNDIEIKIVCKERKLFLVKGTSRLGILENLWAQTETQVRKTNGLKPLGNIRRVAVAEGGESADENQLDQIDVEALESKKDKRRSSHGLHDTSNVSLHTSYYKMDICPLSKARPSVHRMGMAGTKTGIVTFRRLETGQKIIEIEYPDKFTVNQKILIIQACLALERRVHFTLLYQDMKLHWVKWQLLPLMAVLGLLIYMVPLALKIFD